VWRRFFARAAVRIRSLAAIGGFHLGLLVQPPHRPIAVRSKWRSNGLDLGHPEFPDYHGFVHDHRGRASQSARRPPGFFREQLATKSIPSQDLERAIEMLANPVEQAMVYLFFLLFWFMVISIFCTAGGAIGAKVMAKD
jgi:hypothetical protein